MLSRRTSPLQKVNGKIYLSTKRERSRSLAGPLNLLTKATGGADLVIMRRTWGRHFRYALIMLQIALYLQANGEISPIIFSDMELRQLEVLISIADNGSFSGAARALTTVQSNVSAHISRLEKELSTTLVERATGKLTEDGQIVVAHARRVFNQIQDIAAEVQSSEQEIKGECRLGCIGTTGLCLIPAILPVIKARLPNIRVTISEGSTSSLLPRLIDGSLDACIVH